MNYSSSCFSKLNYGADLLVTTDFGLEFFARPPKLSQHRQGVFQWHGNFAEYVLYHLCLNHLISF